MDKVKFEGVPIRLGNRTYIVPPLSTGTMRRMADDIDNLGASGSSVEEQTRATRIAHAAVVRNYPDVTIEEFEELVDTRNVKDLLAAVFGQSAVAPVGEISALPASAQNQSTGNGSIHS